MVKYMIFFFKAFEMAKNGSGFSQPSLEALEILLRAIFTRGFVVRCLVFLFSLADLWKLRVSN